MNKKSIVLICVILIIFIGFLAYTNFTNQNDLKFNKTTFHLPDGFKEKGLTVSGDRNVSNGYESIYFHEYNNNDINNYVNNYIHERNESNFTAILTNFTVDNTTVYKTTIVNQTHSIHYWFVKNNNVYSIYTWDGDKKTDKIVEDLIRSAK